MAPTARIRQLSARFQAASPISGLPEIGEAMSPLHRHMIEHMTVRKFAAKTQQDFVRRV